ncbi:MAG: hypothetical protein ACE5K0_07615 [Candidatus Methanofastidiosia archaeon]
MAKKVRPELDEDKLSYILSFTGETVISKAIHKLAMFCKERIENGEYMKDLEEEKKPIKTKSVRLYVKKANRADVGKNILRIDKVNRDRLSISENTIVEIVRVRED